MRLFTAMYTFVSLVTVAAGVFAAIAPAKAAHVWGWKNLDKLGPGARILYFRVYRAWGVLLCLAGILLAAENPK